MFVVVSLHVCGFQKVVLSDLGDIVWVFTQICDRQGKYVSILVTVVFTEN